MDDSLTTAVVEQVAHIRDANILELPPLSHTIDSEALERLVASAANPVMLEFTYADCHVEIGTSRESPVMIDPMTG